jgi:hypothetical protein
MWENVLDLNALHINRAKEENLMAEKTNIEILPIDDHKVHVDEHIAFLLGNEIKNKKNQKMIKERLLSHIEEHKKFIKNTKGENE